MIGRLETREQQTRIALVIWISVTIGICIYGGMTDWSRSVTGAYATGGQAWVDGVNVFANSSSELHGFLYLPQSAMLWAPLTMLPGDLADPLWRVITIGLFAFGCWRFFRVAEARVEAPMILLMTALTIPAALSGMRNGQSTLPMTGTMLLGCASLMSGHWWRATAWLMLALVFKPLAIALVLVAWVVYPPMWWRMPIGLIAFLLTPFLAAAPAYVVEFYGGFLAKAAAKTQPGLSEEADTFFAADISALIRFLGITLSEGVLLALRLIAAGATLGLSWWSLKRHGVIAGSLLTASWCLIWLVLFNPATENNTYAAVAPIIAIFAVLSLETGRPVLGGILCAMPILIAVNYELTKFVTPGQTEWLCSLVTLVFAVYLTLVTLGAIRRPWTRSEADKRSHA